MSLEQIEREIGAKLRRHSVTDCHMFVWTTQRFLPRAFELLSAWGLNYVFTMVWHKPGGFKPIGLAQYNCEFAIRRHRLNRRVARLFQSRAAAADYRDAAGVGAKAVGKLRPETGTFTAGAAAHRTPSSLLPERGPTVGGGFKGGGTANMGIDDRLEENIGGGLVTISLTEVELSELRATMPLQSWLLACHAAS